MPPTTTVKQHRAAHASASESLMGVCRWCVRWCVRWSHVSSCRGTARSTSGATIVDAPGLQRPSQGTRCDAATGNQCCQLCDWLLSAVRLGGLLNLPLEGSWSSRQAVRRRDAIDGPHVDNGPSCFRVATEYVIAGGAGGHKDENRFTAFHVQT